MKRKNQVKLDYTTYKYAGTILHFHFYSLKFIKRISKNGNTTIKNKEKKQNTNSMFLVTFSTSVHFLTIFLKKLNTQTGN